jgi:hypothetical protein
MTVPGNDLRFAFGKVTGGAALAKIDPRFPFHDKVPAACAF